MIKSFTITNHLGESITLELTRPENSGFIVKSVDGLGPAKASINTTKLATKHGSSYNSARLDQRNITMKLIFYQRDGESIEDIRQRSYRYLPPHKDVHIMIETDNHTLETSGYVESNEPDIWSSQEGCDVSILCPDPFLYSASSNETVFSGVQPTFEFPFENDSVVEPMLELGDIQNKTEAVVRNDSETTVGMQIVIHAVDAAEDITIYNIATREKMILDTSKIRHIYRTETMDDTTITWETGKYLDSDGGVRSTTDESIVVSDFIPVLPNTVITYDLSIRIANPYKTLIAVYDKDKECLGRENAVRADSNKETYAGTYDVPGNAAYIRICHNDGSSGDSVVYMKLSESALIAGDTITIDTTDGNKGITLLRYGESANILNCLDRGSKWLTLKSGDNLIAYTAVEGVANLQFTIFNKVAYIGV